jgi:hypothetical protein
MAVKPMAVLQMMATTAKLMVKSTFLTVDALKLCDT